ncbi:MAG: type I-E CRISPR-associated protein Cas5/CasD [candidate division Zixibacteria bacterium]|jgi:CRISPR system Cascade subunit CasD|nr:type I-E CRISPR-associated protein Cas5/CasD [candidate division Zixibacteria bacterium]
MRDFLVFQLYSPLASWGEVAVGEIRSTLSHPTKTAVLGLIASALGVTRDAEELHRQLHLVLGYACWVVRKGETLRDYHTVQTPIRGNVEKRGEMLPWVRSRRDELLAGRPNTILSDREYRMDEAYVVALWQRSADAFISLGDISDALQRPTFVVFLGRKSCPLALPMSPSIIGSHSLLGALRAYRPDQIIVPETIDDRVFEVYWEELTGEDAEIPVSWEATRYDLLLSRSRWQFGLRSEYAGTIESKQED